jgi:hypothetical protein
MLEPISPWEYHLFRKVLGDGSGFDSLGFRGVRGVTPLELPEGFSPRCTCHDRCLTHDTGVGREGDCTCDRVCPATGGVADSAARTAL